MNNYILWNGQLGGWLSIAGNYSTELSDALVVGAEEAITRCRRGYRRQDGQFHLVPVPVHMINEVTK